MNSKTRIRLLVLMLCSTGIQLFAQESKEIDHVIVSEIFDSERRIRVFLPERYFRDSTQTLVTTYLLDAQSDELWNMAVGNLDYLVRQYQVIPMILVGIVSEDRGEEFDPDSELLARHLQREVFPLVEEKYRISDFRTVVGHSWGGAFVGNTLFSESRSLFNAYIGISPSLGANGG